MTIQQLITFAGTFISVILGIATGYKGIKNSFGKVIENKLAPFNGRIDETIKNNNSKFAELQLQIDRNYLVGFLSDVENGVKKDEVEIAHFYHTLDDYHLNNGNSYIDSKVEKIKKEGKL